jgi:ferritin-like metal-binding protein YciE
MPKQSNQNQTMKQGRAGNSKQPGNSTRQQSSSDESEDSTSMEDNPLHDVWLDEIADVNNAEQQLVKALPKMAAAAQSEELRAAFESHLVETKNQITRLEEVVTSVGETLKSKKCKAMEGLLAEGKEMMEEHEGEPTIDAVLVAAAQKVEHYEIASYGTLVAWAKQMGHDDAAELLEETLEEEKAADEALTQIAESSVNAEAEQEDKE